LLLHPIRRLAPGGRGCTFTLHLGQLGCDVGSDRVNGWLRTLGSVAFQPVCSSLSMAFARSCTSESFARALAAVGRSYTFAL
jgi:hypothetical protein